MAKAEKGDLIRIVKKKHGHMHKIGEIVEVVKVTGDSEISTGGWFVHDSEYEIFRKAGEEDSEKCEGSQSIQEQYAEYGKVKYGTSAPTDAQITQANRIRSACSELADLLVLKNHY